jgi:hypothetical protein
MACRAEVASLCVDIWHFFSRLCTTHTLPSGSSAGVACDVAQSDLTMCLWMVWHSWMVAYHMAWAEWGDPVMACHVACGAHLSGACVGVGPTCWLGQMRECHVTLGCWGVGTAIWHCNSNWIFELAPLLISKLYPERSPSPNCTRRSLWSNLNYWSIHLICFIFSEFILIAHLVQKL